MEMEKPGYIYALINPSLSGLVKVGKTQKEPAERAKELSNSTSVPTPFIVGFKVFANNIDDAEKYLHTLLEHKGLRLNVNREFFNAELDEIIDSMLMLKENFKNIDESLNDIVEDNEFDKFSYSQGDEFLDNLTIEDEPEYFSVFKLAEEFYFGYEDTIEDHYEALKLFKKAAILGCIEAYTVIGYMYMMGDGCNKSLETALKYFKEGVSKGNETCYALMAQLFASKNHLLNSKKCYKKYFESSTFKNRKFETSIFITQTLWLTEQYLICDVDSYGVSDEFVTHLIDLKEEIINNIIRKIDMVVDEEIKKIFENNLKRIYKLFEKYENL